MRIPFDYLLYRLNNPEINVICRPMHENSPISRPRFLMDGQEPEPGRLYIAPLDYLSAPCQAPFSSAILITSDPAGLLNQIQDLYDQCESWADMLSASAAIGEMRELLDETESILGNPVLLYKPNYAIVACSGEIFSNPELAALRGSHLPFEYVNTLKQDPQFDRLEGETAPFFCASPSATTPAMAVNLFLEAGVSHRLAVIPQLQPIDAACRFPLELCAEYVGQALKNKVIASRYADPTGRKKRLMDLFRTGIETKNADPTVLEQGFSALGWLPSHQYCCLSICIGTPDYLAQTVSLLCNQLGSLLTASCIIPHHGTIAVLMNLTLADATVQTLLKKCIYFFRDNDLRSGVSNVFTGFQLLRSYHKQADIALDYASRPQTLQWVQHFSEVVLDYIMEQSNRELPLDLICSQQILAIRQYDREHQADFYTTLDAYIRNKFNAVQTAKELQIHRSTFLYRMDRLQNLFGLDLDHQDTLLYTLLSMKMLDSSKSMMLHE